MIYYNVKLINQEGDYDCWFASLSMLLAYFKRDASMLQSIRLKEGDKRAGSEIFSKIGAACNMVGILLHDDVNRLSDYSFKDLERLLDKYGPIGCGLTLGDNAGHMILIVGTFGNDGVIFNDPDPSAECGKIKLIKKGKNGKDSVMSFQVLLQYVDIFMVFCPDTLAEKWSGQAGRWKCDKKDVGW